MTKLIKKTFFVEEDMLFDNEACYPYAPSQMNVEFNLERIKRLSALCREHELAWVAEYDCPDLRDSDGTQIPLDQGLLYVDSDSFWWEIVPKLGADTVESRVTSIADVEEAEEDKA